MSDLPEAADEHTHFGKYLLDRELARGGMARVFRARLRGPGGFEKKLVVKQILPELAADPSFVELFVKEANTLVQMSHPNVVPVYELGVIDGVYFLAMEWVEGATVAELLGDGPLPEALVAQIGAQIAEALQYAHERFQIVHRDVTPRNVIVDAAGHARLLDFGIAAPLGHSGSGELFGSPGYMAPEQLRREALGAETDLFGLGSVIYEAASGRPAQPDALARRNLESYAPPAPLREIERTLAGWIERLLALDRTQRPQRAAEVSEALRTWLAERHPRGVVAELAARVSRARARRASEPARTLDVPAAGSSGRIEVRSLAVSPALAELLQHKTERLERASPVAPDAPDSEPASPNVEPGLSEVRVSGRPPEPERMADDPELHRIVKRLLRDAAVIGMALFVAVYYANHRVREEEDDAGSSAGAPLAPTAPAPQTSAPAPVAPPPDPHSEQAPTSSPEHAAQPAASEAGDVASRKTGFLTVSASPWAEVQVDGRGVGVTPRRNLQLRAGKHTLTLHCPPLDRQARVPFELQPGQSLRVVADLHEQPAKVSVQ